MMNQVHQDMPITPTLQRIQEVHEQAEAIGAFLEWGQEHGLTVCRLNSRSDYYPAESIDNLLHLYFQIDAKEEEREKRALLEYVRGKLKV